jgi:hypothetical protein
MSASTSMSFAGCTTREQVLERLAAFLDDIADDHVRAVASRWLVDDGAACDAAAFQNEVAQLRAAFTEKRVAILAKVAAIIVELERP